MSTINGRAYIVSGALSGIGLAVTLMLITAGGFVWVADTGSNLPPQLAGHPQRKNIHCGGPCDVRSRKDCEDIVAAVVSAKGRLDGLVNCAGICLPEGLLASDEIFQHEFDVNVRGTWNLGTAAIKQMAGQDILEERQGRGSIVNVGSGASLQGIAGLAVYCMTKHAVLGLTRSWAQDWAKQGIRVNAVAPGVTDTPMYRSQFESSEELVKVLLAGIPIGRIANPDEVAGTITFLLSDQASYILGQIISLSGGT